MILFVIEQLDNEVDKKFILDIYEKYAPWMRARAYNITKDPEISNDLAHDCIISLIRHTDKLRTFNDTQLRAYIAIAIDHTTINYVKHSSRTFLVSENEEFFFDNLPDKDDVEEIVETKFNIETVRENLKHLPKRDRDLIILKYDLEMSDREIGQIVGIKENSVRMTVRRSVARLGNMVKEVAR